MNRNELMRQMMDPESLDAERAQREAESQRLVQIQANHDGTWSEAEPIEYAGWKADLEQWFLAWGFPRLGRLMGRWDERGLGK